jgi:leader peptidase (prepilin peptidase)/N-methyltransferase
VNEIALLTVFGAFAGAVGLVIGSFLNVCIARLPQDQSVVTPRSHCDVCGHLVRAKDNVPVLSWLWLRGRCRDCGARIPAVVPLVELLGGLLAVLCFRRFVPDVASLDVGHGLAWALWFGFLCLLVVQATVDLRHRIIPDETSIYAAPFGILGALALAVVGYDGWLSLDWKASVTGAVIAGGGFAIVSRLTGLVLRRETLGWGDVKLMTMIGAFLGALPGALFVVLLGTTIGAITGIAHVLWARGSGYVPLAPSMAFAAMVYVLYGDVALELLAPNASIWRVTTGSPF